MLIFLLLISPVLAGALLTKGTTKEWADNIIYVYMIGFMLLLAGTEVLSVPLTILKKSFSLYTGIYNVFLAVIVLLSVLLARDRIKAVFLTAVRTVKNCDRNWIWILLGIYVPIIVLEFFTTYIYGDDKVYLAMVNDMVTSDRLYLTNIETGGEDGWVIAKYALSSYWTWVAYLVRMSKIHVLILCKSIMPFLWVPLGYAVQGLLAAYFFKGDKRKIWIFMMVVLVVTLFGGFSTYPVTYRFYTWVWQSKALLAIIVMPFLFFYCNDVFSRVPTGREYVFLVIMNIATCSTSLTGTGLAVGMVCILAAMYALIHKKLRIVVLTGLTCIPSLFLMAFYLKYDDILARINFYF